MGGNSLSVDHTGMGGMIGFGQSRESIFDGHPQESHDVERGDQKTDVRIANKVRESLHLENFNM